MDHLLHEHTSSSCQDPGQEAQHFLWMWNTFSCTLKNVIMIRLCQTIPSNVWNFKNLQRKSYRVRMMDDKIWNSCRSEDKCFYVSFITSVSYWFLKNSYFQKFYYYFYFSTSYAKYFLQEVLKNVLIIFFILKEKLRPSASSNYNYKDNSDWYFSNGLTKTFKYMSSLPSEQTESGPICLNTLPD